MKKIVMILAAFAMCGTVAAKAAGNDEKSKLESDPIITIFTNYHQGVGSSSNDSGFDLDRAYFGYKVSYNGELSAQVLFDVGKIGDKNDYAAYLKNASVTWKRDRFAASFGLIKTANFALQESFWGYRYVGKVYSDENGFAPSADLGLLASYKFNDWLKADVQITNGEGYKKIEVDKSSRYGVGVTLEPLENLIVRAYYDVNTYNKEVNPTYSTEQVITAFVGYEGDKFSIAGEFNRAIDSDHIDGLNYNGYSVFSNVKLSEELSLFGRFDYTDTDHSRAPLYGTRLWGGLAYEPYKFLNISPNIQSSNLRGEESSETFIYINVLVKW